MTYDCKSSSYELLGSYRLCWLHWQSHLLLHRLHIDRGPKFNRLLPPYEYMFPRLEKDFRGAKMNVSRVKHVVSPHHKI